VESSAHSAVRHGRAECILDSPLQDMLTEIWNYGTTFADPGYI
jgi:hypothetical protein